MTARAALQARLHILLGGPGRDVSDCDARQRARLAHAVVLGLQDATGASRHARRVGVARIVPGMTRYRFLDGMGDVVAETEFDGHEAALSWAVDEDGPEEEVQRVEYLGAEGDWRWAGALRG